jgi:uncharacterized protein (DUF433 family)
MLAGLTTRIDVDAAGVAWIADANTKVIEIVLDRIAHGWSPEEIHFQHAHLSLAQIHAALAYYYENQETLDAQIRADLGDADRQTSAGRSSALQLKLGAISRPA